MEKLSPLGSEESIFSNSDSLDPDFVPVLMPYRENKIREIAESLKPLLRKEGGRNLLITGKAGIGKTHAVKKVLKEFKEESETALIFYVNCWTNSTDREVFEKISSQLGVPSKRDVTASSIFNKILSRISGRPIVLCFDEIDQAKEFGFLYSFLEQLKTKSVILISNKTDFLAGLGDRIRSRLMPKEIKFREYSREEIAGILKERRKYAFFQNTWSKKAMELVEDKAFEKRDLRLGIKLLRESGLKAEQNASRKVKEKHVKQALEKLAL